MTSKHKSGTSRSGGGRASATGRRDFLKLAGFGAVAGAAAAGGGAVAAAPAAAEPAATGYRESEHVRKFYALARF